VRLEDFKAIMPRCQHPEIFHPYLVAAMVDAEISTVTRAAAFLAQIAHESGECRFLNEWGDGKAYEGRKDLGNTERGDGPRYKGRGVIQLTGRRNYRDAGRALGIELELYPEEAAKPLIACRVAAWYWRTRGCNDAADIPDFELVTRKINGALRGYIYRQDYYRRALEVLGRRVRLEV